MYAIVSEVSLVYGIVSAVTVEVIGLLSFCLEHLTKSVL